MNWLARLYNEIWYHSQFWVDKTFRRPFTLTMRDCFNKSPLPTMIILCLIVAGAYGLCSWVLPLGFFLTAVVFMVLGHVVWGERWQEGEQENPTYIEDN